MNQTLQVEIAAPDVPHATPLAEHFACAPLVSYRGAMAASSFSGFAHELAALIGGAGVFDLGFLSFIEITGSDRVRWLNGMVTNTVQSLEEGHFNYSLLLNAQGRIQGDGHVYRFADRILLATDRSQTARIVAHLDHFIIMDDVELRELDASHTALGIAGPQAERILRDFELTPPFDDAFLASTFHGAPVTVVRARSAAVARYELWIETARAAALWDALVAAGAVPGGVAALEALRVLEGTPRYGVDILEKHLPQETGLSHALNFNKGCYLGQEIVERIRSRATVHRTLRQFSLDGALPEAGSLIPLTAEGAQHNPIGELTSFAQFDLPAYTGKLALGFIRTEALERKLPLHYSGGTAAALDAPPSLGA
jgi:folate-binding protein YgfZ